MKKLKSAALRLSIKNLALHKIRFYLMKKAKILFQKILKIHGFAFTFKKEELFPKFIQFDLILAILAVIIQNIG